MRTALTLSLTTFPFSFSLFQAPLAPSAGPAGSVRSGPPPSPPRRPNLRFRKR